MGLFSKKKDDIKKEDTAKKAPQVKLAKEEKSAPASMKDLYGGATVTSATKTGKGANDAAGAKTVKLGSAYRIIVKPLITEKAANLGAENKYVFVVSDNANKIEIAKAINELYGIKPIDVNIIRTEGKKVRHGRMFGKRKDWKKAIVKLPVGKTINIYEGV